MKAALLALLLAAASAENNALFALYAEGHYEEAMRQGAAAGTAAGLRHRRARRLGGCHDAARALPGMPEAR